MTNFLIRLLFRYFY